MPSGRKRTKPLRAAPRGVALATLYKKSLDQRRKIEAIVERLFASSPETIQQMGGRNRWKGRGNHPVLKRMVKKCDALYSAGKTVHECNGVLYGKFCGKGKPGYRLFSKDTVRIIAASVYEYRDGTKKGAVREKDLQDS